MEGEECLRTRAEHIIDIRYKEILALSLLPELNDLLLVVGGEGADPSNR
jgi:hypothetical protein